MSTPPDHSTDIGIVQERRSALRALTEYRFVDPEEYCRLATSSQRLVRRDNPAAQLRGLHDPALCIYYCVELEKLASYACVR